MRDRVVESIHEIKRLFMSSKSLFSSPAPKVLKQHLSKLQNDKLLKRVGSRKDSYWEVLDD
jgi:hypothetical protein